MLCIYNKHHLIIINYSSVSARVWYSQPPIVKLWGSVMFHIEVSLSNPHTSRKGGTNQGSRNQGSKGGTAGSPAFLPKGLAPTKIVRF